MNPLPPRSSAWEFGVKLPQNSSKSELLQEINQLKDIIDEQKRIISSMDSIENNILKMKHQYKDKIVLFDTLRNKIKELEKTNEELNARIMILWRNSPTFEPKNNPPPKLNSNVPAFVPKPEKLQPHAKILKLPKDPKPEPNSNLRY
tara:strand:+ start:1124 stop:1564 length:441 start_codon:yes stop_codon:yes gene_type:complete